MNKILFLIGSFLCFLLLLGCNGNQVKNFTKKGTVEFNIGFSPTTFANSMHDNRDFIGFADFRTHKKIKIFDYKGNELIDVSVEPLMESENCSLVAFALPSFDTIAILGRNNNQVYLINRRGELLDKRDFSSINLKEATIFPPFYYRNGQIRTGLVYKDTNQIPVNWEEYKEQNQRRNNFYLSMLDDETKANQLLMDSLYSRFANDS